MKSYPSLPTASRDAETVAVQEIMSTDLVALTGSVAIPANANIAQAAAVMAHESLAVLPVIDDRGRPLGTISAADVVRWIATSAGYVTR